MRFAYGYVMANRPERVREIAPAHAAYWELPRSITIWADPSVIARADSSALRSRLWSLRSAWCLVIRSEEPAC